MTAGAFKLTITRHIDYNRTIEVDGNAFQWASLC